MRIRPGGQGPVRPGQSRRSTRVSPVHQVLMAGGRAPASPVLATLSARRLGPSCRKSDGGSCPRTSLHPYKSSSTTTTEEADGVEAEVVVVLVAGQHCPSQGLPPKTTPGKLGRPPLDQSASSCFVQGPPESALVSETSAGGGGGGGGEGEGRAQPISFLKEMVGGKSKGPSDFRFFDSVTSCYLIPLIIK